MGHSCHVLYHRCMCTQNFHIFTDEIDYVADPERKVKLKRLGDGEGNDNPLQYSCLGNATDRGAWRATVHGVAGVRHDSHHHHWGWMSGTTVPSAVVPTLKMFPTAPCFVHFHPLKLSGINIKGVNSVSIQ